MLDLIKKHKQHDKIYNPISFISGKIAHSNEYITLLIELIKLYQQLEYQPTLEHRFSNKILSINI